MLTGGLLPNNRATCGEGVIYKKGGEEQAATRGLLKNFFYNLATPDSLAALATALATVGPTLGSNAAGII